MWRAFSLLLALLMTLPVGTRAQDESTELEALSLAIEENMGIESFRKDCRGFGGYTTTVMVIPINEEIVNATVAYKAKTEQLSSRKEAKLQRQVTKEFVHGDHATFVLITLNETKDQDEIVQFANFKENVDLYTETKKFSLEKYTRNFDAPLSEGWNKGYLYFKNFRPSGSNSYSVHLKGLTLQCPSDQATHQVAFEFDRSEIEFLSLLQKGVSESEIRNRYSIGASASSDLSRSDVLNIVSILVSVASML